MYYEDYVEFGRYQQQHVSLIIAPGITGLVPREHAKDKTLSVDCKGTEQTLSSSHPMA